MGTPATAISRGVWVGGIEIDFDGADLKQSLSTVFAPFGVPVTAGLEADQNSVGFVVGGSVETMFGHFMIRGEFLHYDFGMQSINFPNSGVFFAGNVWRTRMPRSPSTSREAESPTSSKGQWRSTH